MMPTPHQLALAAWTDHASAKREETESLIHAGLVEAYPDYHITRTNTSKCDVLGYANAGFATATPQDEAGYDATRIYRAPKSQLDDLPGNLEDVVSFGKWNLSYESTDFIVYEVNFMSRFMDVVKLQYILAPSVPASKDTLHHPKTDELLLASGAWTRDVHEEVWVFDDQEWSKSKSLWKSVQGTTWDDVVLEPAMRSKLHRDVHGFFDNREVYRKAHIAWKRGIIFHGVPGNGKSMTLAVMINELAKRDPPIPALYVKSLDACSGPKWSLQEIFRKARRTAPCLLVLEDLDSLVTDNTRSYFLNEVDGLESNDGILIIGSTNHLDRLDTSVTKRPSRFDRKYHFKIPDEAERLAYCRHWRKKFIDSAEIEMSDELCEVIAKWTVGYSFAYLKELFVTSLLLHTHGSDEDGADRMECERESVSSKRSEGIALNGVTSEAQKEVEPEGATPTVEVNGEASKSGVEGEEPSEPRTLPNVDIPQSLKHNNLLSIFRTQAQTLLEEMDHSTSAAERRPTAPSDPPIRYRLPSMLDNGDD